MLLNNFQFKFLIFYNLLILAILISFKMNIYYYYYFILNIFFINFFIKPKCFEPTKDNPLMNYNKDINKLKSCKYNDKILNKIDEYIDDPIFENINDLNYKNKFNRYFYNLPVNTYINQ